MRFTWDENKNAANIAKHALDFTDAPRLFDYALLCAQDEREDYAETRSIAILMLDGRVLVVVYTEPDDLTVRIISLRKALSQERRHYENYLKDQLGEG